MEDSNHERGERRMRVRHKLGEKAPERDREEMIWKNSHDVK